MGWAFCRGIHMGDRTTRWQIPPYSTCSSINSTSILISRTRGNEKSSKRRTVSVSCRSSLFNYRLHFKVIDWGRGSATSIYESRLRHDQSVTWKCYDGLMVRIYSLRQITFTMLSTFHSASRLDQVSPHSANWLQTLQHQVQFDPELEWPRGNWSEWDLAPRPTNLATNPAKSKNISAKVILPSTFYAWFPF